jgi:hypothetical protein
MSRIVSKSAKALVEVSFSFMISLYSVALFPDISVKLHSSFEYTIFFRYTLCDSPDVRLVMHC